MTRTVAARILGTATVTIGAAMLARPAAVNAIVGAGGAAAPNPTIVRVLGGRQLLQGAAVVLLPRQSIVLTGGSIIDVLHAASMVGAALLWPRYRRPALASATVAGTSAIAGLLISRRRS